MAHISFIGMYRSTDSLNFVDQNGPKPKTHDDISNFGFHIMFHPTEKSTPNGLESPLQSPSKLMFDPYFTISASK